MATKIFSLVLEERIKELEKLIKKDKKVLLEANEEGQTPLLYAADQVLISQQINHANELLWKKNCIILQTLFDLLMCIFNNRAERGPTETVTEDGSRTKHY